MKGVVDDKMVSSALSILKRSSVLWEAQIAILPASTPQNTTATKLVTDAVNTFLPFSHSSFYEGLVRAYVTLLSLPVTYRDSCHFDLHPSVPFVLTDPISRELQDGDE